MNGTASFLFATDDEKILVIVRYTDGNLSLGLPKGACNQKDCLSDMALSVGEPLGIWETGETEYVRFNIEGKDIVLATKVNVKSADLLDFSKVRSKLRPGETAKEGLALVSWQSVKEVLKDNRFSDPDLEPAIALTLNNGYFDGRKSV